MKYIGVDHIRIYCHPRFLQHEIKELEDISVESLRNLYSKNISALDEYMSENEVTAAKKYEFQIIMEVGEGTFDTTPIYKDSQIDPTTIGKDLYLAYIYRYSRSCVRQYKDYVKLYQIENELNEAKLESLAGVRLFSLTKNPWLEWDFLTDLLKTLRFAVKDEGDDLYVTQNFHCEVSKKFHDEFDFKGYYMDALKDWNDLLDFVSFDSYPNFLQSQPILPEKVGEITKNIVDFVGNEKSVIVMECNYPLSNLTAACPFASLNFTEEHQAEFLTKAVEYHRSNGGDGFFVFQVKKTPGMNPPPGGWTEKDAEAMHMLAKVSDDSSVLDFIEWLFKKGNIEYLTTRFVTLLEDFQQKRFGLLRMDGSKRPAVETLKAAYEKIG